MAVTQALEIGSSTHTTAEEPRVLAAASNFHPARFDFLRSASLKGRARQSLFRPANSVFFLSLANHTRDRAVAV